MLLHMCWARCLKTLLARCSLGAGSMAFGPNPDSMPTSSSARPCSLLQPMVQTDKSCSAADAPCPDQYASVLYCDIPCKWGLGVDCNGQAAGRCALHLEHDCTGREGPELAGTHWQILLVPWLALELVMLVQQGLVQQGLVQQVCSRATEFV